MRDQQAYLGFVYQANVEVACMAMKIIEQYHAKSAACSCFVGRTTGVPIAVSPKPC
jgi:hypothetical protein